jgi:transglutaminase/protease-like cytokinesis protein 3
MKGRVVISVLVIALAVISCRNNPAKSEEFVLANTDSLAASVNPAGNSVEEIYRNLSSPLEIANLFQVMGVPFSPGYLA